MGHGKHMSTEKAKDFKGTMKKLAGYLAERGTTISPGFILVFIVVEHRQRLS